MGTILKVLLHRAHPLAILINPRYPPVSGYVPNTLLHKFSEISAATFHRHREGL